MQKKISPSKFYSLSEIVKEGLIPNMDTVPKMSRLVRSDMLYHKILNAAVVARGERGIQYKVLGRNIIKYLVQTER